MYLLCDRLTNLELNTFTDVGTQTVLPTPAVQEISKRENWTIDQMPDKTKKALRSACLMQEHG